MKKIISDYERLQGIFLAVIELESAEERAVYLADACGENASIRESIESLVKEYEQTCATSLGSGMSMVEESGHDRVSEKPGTMIGRYKILEQIGEGGFGNVYMADQTEPVKRRVALKVIKPGMNTKEVVARFDAERQAFAMMDHPNIAKELDAGASESGRPFFVMELVKGIPITQFCNDQELDIPQRLSIFLDVCSAVQHAHQKGIIHRDLKPTNILVTMNADNPVPKVIDFGIAKTMRMQLTEKTVFTRFGQFMGTPVYMSPEQAALSEVDMDTRSDIYALGVILYELLTGKPPFDAKSLISVGYDEMRRIIREDEPPRPSARLSTIAGDERTAFTKQHHAEPGKLGRLVRGDLDWIVMKAIEKDRSRRFDTANALAADIRRYLRDEAVYAAAPSMAYKFSKFVRRNKPAIGVAALIAVVMIIATVVSIRLALLATEAQEKSKKSLADSHEAHKKSNAIRRFLTELYRSPDPDRDGSDVKVVEGLDRAAAKVDAELSNQPELQAYLRADLGATYRNLGLPEKSIPLVEKARDYFRDHLGLANPRTIQTSSEVAFVYADAGRLDDAIKEYKELRDFLVENFGKKDHNSLNVLHNLANVYLEKGRIDEAISIQVEVLRLRKEVDGPVARDTLAGMGNLARSYMVKKKFKEALDLQEDVWEITQRQGAPKNTDTIKSLIDLSSTCGLLGQAERALHLRELALDMFCEIYGPKQRETLRGHEGIGNDLHARGKMEEGMELQEKNGNALSRD